MLSRRRFLTGTLGAGLTVAAQGLHPTAYQTPAAPAGRRRMIVDSQVHLWLAEGSNRPWPPDGPPRAHIPRPFSYYELLARMDEAGVDRVVIVPPSWEGYRGTRSRWRRRREMAKALCADGAGQARRPEIEGSALHLARPARRAWYPPHLQHAFNPVGSLMERRRLVLAGRRQGQHCR